MKLTLLVLAAGMGSRYGGLKQVDPVGPGGEALLDYSVFDAIEAGFERVVFVIRRDFAEDFKRQVSDRFVDRLEVGHVFQEVGDLPNGYWAPEGRSKPWGTAHAIFAAREVIQGPFATINADDFYGREAYHEITAYLNALANPNALHLGMVGYQLGKTLSGHGRVNRGLCRVAKGQLIQVEEYTEIGPAREGGGLSGKNELGHWDPIPADSTVSMNFWGFTPSIFDSLIRAFSGFLEAHGGELQSEWYLPTVVDTLLQSGEVACSVLETAETWFGVTYPEDKASVVSRLQKLIQAGEYPRVLS